MDTAQPAPFGDLNPFVVAIASKRVQAGETLTPAMLGDCLRQAADEYKARVVRWFGLGDYESSRHREMRESAMEALSLSVYNSIPAGPAEWNPRWIRCAAALGVSPEELRPTDFLCWKDR